MVVCDGFRGFVVWLFWLDVGLQLITCCWLWYLVVGIPVVLGGCLLVGLDCCTKAA